MSEQLPRAFGPYVLRRVLGAGAGGTVYLARPHGGLRGWPSQLVVKILRKEMQRDRDFVARFEHEAKIAVRVDHPNVVRVLDAGEHDESLYIAMEFVDGHMLATLRAALEDGGPALPVPVALGIVTQLLEGVAALHGVTDAEARNIEFVHRDLSPRNVMVDATGLVRVIDFGLGKSTLQDWKTRAGTTLGSAGYMPPEQAAGDAVDQSADLYAIGAIAYELLAGRRMIAPATPLEMLHATLAHRYRSIGEVRPEVAASLDDVVRRATASVASERFATAGEMLAAFLATGVEAADRVEIARVLHERHGPVVPVDLGADIDSMELTKTSGETRVLARREGLVVPAIEELMYQPTRAELASHEPSDFVMVRPVPNRRPLFAAGIAVTMTGAIVAGLWFLATTERPPPPPPPTAPVVAAPAQPAVAVQPRPNALPAPTVTKKKPVVEAPLKAKTAPPPRRRAPPKPKAKTKLSKPTAPASVKAQIRALEKRCAAIIELKGASGEKKDAAKQILLDVVPIERIDEASARERLAELRRRVAALER